MLTFWIYVHGNIYCGMSIIQYLSKKTLILYLIYISKTIVNCKYIREVFSFYDCYNVFPRLKTTNCDAFDNNIIIICLITLSQSLMSHSHLIVNFKCINTININGYHGQSYKC